MNRSIPRIAASVLLALVLASPAFAQTASPKPAAATGETAAVRKILEERFPGAQIKHMAKVPYMGGVYEVMFDDQMLYVDPKVNYIFVGQVYDAKSKTNLTEQQVRKINRVAFSELPLNLAIKKVKGDGSRKVAVFSDADCPFCARLEESLKGVDNVTIYTFLYPIDQLHPDAARKSRLIWCAPDKVKAWDDFFTNGSLPSNAGDCDNPVAATATLGQKLRISATPTLVFADGTLVPGALPPAGIESELARAEVEAKKLAAGK